MDSTNIKFRILADGKEVYKSDVIRKDTPAEFVSLDIKGVKRLVLIADDVDGNLVGDFASWADTKLYQNYLKPVIKGDDVIVFNTKEKVDLLQGLSLIHIQMCIRDRDSPYFTEGNIKRGVKIKALEEKYNCTTSQILLGYILNLSLIHIQMCIRDRIHTIFQCR